MMNQLYKEIKDKIEINKNHINNFVLDREDGVNGNIRM